MLRAAGSTSSCFAVASKLGLVQHATSFVCKTSGSPAVHTCMYCFGDAALQYTQCSLRRLEAGTGTGSAEPQTPCWQSGQPRKLAMALAMAKQEGGWQAANPPPLQSIERGRLGGIYCPCPVGMHFLVPGKL
jgi:hypothetical protein